MVDEGASQSEVRGRRKTKTVNQEVVWQKNCVLPRDIQAACQRKGGMNTADAAAASYARGDIKLMSGSQLRP